MINFVVSQMSKHPVVIIDKLRAQILFPSAKIEESSGDIQSPLFVRALLEENPSSGVLIEGCEDSVLEERVSL